jgi:hypothetical protein
MELQEFWSKSNIKDTSFRLIYVGSSGTDCYVIIKH